MKLLASRSCQTLCAIQHVNSAGQRQSSVCLPKTHCRGTSGESGAKDAAVTPLKNSVNTTKRIPFLKHYLLSQTHFAALTTPSLTKINRIYFRYKRIKL